MDDELLHRFAADRPRLLAYLRSLLPPSLVEDAYHETFLVVHGKLATFDRERDFGRWVRGIARLVAKRVGIRDRRSVATPPEAVIDRIDQAFDEMPDQDDFGTQLDRLKTCLERLSPAQRDLLRRRLVDGVSYQHLASDSGRSPGSVQVAVSRLKTQLLECIGLES